jgi:SAM-dependent methyltransferase
VAQNIYDTAEFFEGYRRLNRSLYGLDGAPEWRAYRRFGLRFGWFARWARTQGAAYVLGIDLSENMLARARGETTDPAVEYVQQDLERLELPGGAFGLAYSSLAFHYIEDFGRLIRTVFRTLVPGSHLVFTIELPVYMAPTKPEFLVNEDGRRVCPLDSYFIEGSRVTDWLAKGVVKQHRTMSTTLNTLVNSGFSIRHVEEWHPTPEHIAAHPDWAEELDRPLILLISAQR